MMRRTQLAAAALLWTSTIAVAGQHRNPDGSVSDDVLIESNGQVVGPANPLPVGQPDARNTGSLSVATPNAAYTVALGGGQGVAGFKVSGLTGSGATLVPEASNDNGTTWSAINALLPGSPTLLQTVTVDGQFRVNAGGHTQVRLRVSVAGTGSVAVASTVSIGNPLVVLSAPAPVTPTGAALAPTTVTLPAGISTTLIGANPARKSLRWMVTGSNPATVAPGLVPVTAGTGLNYNGAPSPGAAGMWETFEGPAVPTNAFSAISTNGTTIVVWEGQ